jgi:hypothetical protein
MVPVALEMFWIQRVLMRLVLENHSKVMIYSLAANLNPVLQLALPLKDVIRPTGLVI